jgi:hypothetical protein
MTNVTVQPRPLQKLILRKGQAPLRVLVSYSSAAALLADTAVGSTTTWSSQKITDVLNNYALTTDLSAYALKTDLDGVVQVQSTLDCSTDPDYPAALKGDAYLVGVAGRIGGAAGKAVDLGDWFIATVDNAGGDEATVGPSWTVIEHNLVGALLAENNLSEITNPATARTNLGVYSTSQVDALVTGLLDFKGTQDCSASPNYPVALKGDAYIVSVAGKIGGAAGVDVAVGDWFIALADSAGGTQAAVGASWGVIEHNIVGALTTSDEATAAEIQAGTAGRVVTADGIHDAHLPQALVDAATIAWNMAQGFNAEITLTDGVGASRALGTPTNPKKGLTYVLSVTQGGTGNKTIVFPAEVNFGAAGNPSFSTVAGKVDIVTLYCRSVAPLKFRGVFSKDG